MTQSRRIGLKDSYRVTRDGKQAHAVAGPFLNIHHSQGVGEVRSDRVVVASSPVDECGVGEYYAIVSGMVVVTKLKHTDVRSLRRQEMVPIRQSDNCRLIVHVVQTLLRVFGVIDHKRSTQSITCCHS